MILSPENQCNCQGESQSSANKASMNFRGLNLSRMVAGPDVIDMHAP
jgi:hypothetical protein